MSRDQGEEGETFTPCADNAITGVISLVSCVCVCVFCKDEIKSRSPIWLLALPLVSFGLSPRCSQ